MNISNLRRGVVSTKRNVPSTNWSKFLYSFYKHHLNFQTKWDFCVTSYSLVSWRINSFASVRKCVVQLRCNATILNEFSQSLEGKKISFVIACQSAHRTEVLKKITTRLGFFNSGKTKASFQVSGKHPDCNELLTILSLIHIWRCRRSTLCRSRWSPYH